MTTLTASRKEYLTDTYEGRVTFDKTERKLYGHDVGDMPRLIKPLVGNTVPEGVVQPESEEELAELLKWAYQNNVPVTPRSKATTGYGGVLPVKNGLVVDFFRLADVISLDKNALTVTVQPGIVWDQLDNWLSRRGFTLRLYPTSYLASTPGGWLAQGGAGIGSYESGWFRENVTSAKVVLPNGDVREHTGKEIDLVSDAEGTTGFISEITIKVQPLEDLSVVSLSTDSAIGLQSLTEEIVKSGVPIWSFLFINPRMAEMKNKAPLRTHMGHPAEERVELPVAYIITLTYRKKDADQVESILAQLATQGKCTKLDDHIAEHEWENRFKVMLVKRLGPGLVPAEIVLPLDSLATALDEIGSKITQPVVKEGIVIRRSKDGKPEIVILGFIPSDQRKFSYLFVFSLSLSIMKIAEKNGGRAYSTGLYFSSKANSVLGKQRVGELKAYKQAVDPKGLLNPGKIFSNNVVGRVIGMAGTMEPITRAFGNLSKTRIGERITKDFRGIPADVAWHAYSCSQCGNCVGECDQFYGRGWESQSPRGKWYWLREFMEGREDWTQEMVDTFLVCTTCELCNLRCSESLPIEPSWMKLRGKLIEDQKKMTFPPFEMMAEALSTQGNIWAGYRKNRLEWFPEDLLEKHGPGNKGKNVYFTGCTASYVEHDIGIATVRLLDAAGVDFVHVGNNENCCGTPMLVAGKWELFAETMKKNIALVKAAGADTVISSCPACDMMWRSVYAEWSKKLGIPYDLKALHYSEVVSDKIKKGEFSFPDNGKGTEKITWHDSCHMGRVSGVYEPPRDLIKANPNAEFVEMASNRDCGKCCGSVLTLIKEPPVAAEIGKNRLDEAVEIGADKVLALCPCCEFQLRVSADKKQVPVEVVDLARYSAEALGYELPDPNPEVKKQWAVFEAMIELMTPEGFADLMCDMWKELIDAMPLGMGPMMRFFGKVPGALTLMKPLFPVLFPRLLPIMMPKVMPKMLELVGKRIPMPDYMEEQMPDIMPKVMANLMPHMIGDVVPLITGPMINYLHAKTEQNPKDLLLPSILSPPKN